MYPYLPSLQFSAAAVTGAARPRTPSSTIIVVLELGVAIKLLLLVPFCFLLLRF